jgi:predicted lipoprotein with Yx(FWY)xxD motif
MIPMKGTADAGRPGTAGRCPPAPPARYPHHLGGGCSRFDIRRARSRVTVPTKERRERQMNMRTTRPRTVALGVVSLGLALLATACASGQTAAAGAAPGSGGATVSVRTVNGAAMLVGPDGKTLYTNNQDRPGRPMCTSSACTAIWAPLTVHGAQPMSGGTVTGKVASVALADGTRQVTWQGMPLYTFSFDHSPGTATGDGVHDSFGGTSFVWHAAVTQGQPSMQPSSGSGFSY